MLDRSADTRTPAAAAHAPPSSVMFNLGLMRTDFTITSRATAPSLEVRAAHEPQSACPPCQAILT
eukprot:7377853-Prymnesium_polylepis.2